MRRILRLLALAMLFVFPLASWAGFIRGQVRFENGEYANRVVVRLRSDVVAYQTETQTDPEGKFSFDGLPLTTFHLIIEGQGFRTYASTLDISISKMAYEQITLHPAKEAGKNGVPPEGPAGILNARIAEIPADARKEFEAGRKRMKAHDDAGSVQHFQKAIALYPDYAEAYQLLGVVHVESGKLNAAEPELVKSTEIEPNLSTAHFALGVCRNLLAKYKEAEAALLRGLQLDPLAAEGHYELAKTYWQLGRWQDAETQAERAVFLKADLAGAHILLGDVELRKRDARGALKEYREALRLDPKDPMAAATQQMVDRIEKAEQQPPQTK